MREPAKLHDSKLIGTVSTEYGISISELTFLPLGADAGTFVYRAEASGGVTYFLKLRALQSFRPASLLVPLFLQEQGIPNILPPVRTIANAPWVVLNDFILSIFPFVEGIRGANAGLSEGQWADLGTTIKQVHSCQIPSELSPIIPRECFTPSRREVIRQLQAAIDRHTISDSIQNDLAEFWKSRWEDIRSLVKRADELSNQLRETSTLHVLCHADLHTWNLMLDSSDQMWLVDWDETTYALKERDLMFVISGIGRDLISIKETECFMQGYGEIDIDLKALTYYRYAWAVQDIGAYGEQVFFSPNLGEASRRDALEFFMGLFEAGNIVDIAFGSDSST
jgi:spectinomycin phosphotransferase